MLLPVKLNTSNIPPERSPKGCTYCQSKFTQRLVENLALYLLSCVKRTTHSSSSQGIPYENLRLEKRVYI